jgi:peptidoglycan/LPS O-acetylase OafA/YrhL
MIAPVLVDAPPADMARAPAPHLQHIRSLDGLRGVAVGAVVLYHFAPSLLPGGFLGVDVFFVLSGFLITSLLVTEWNASGRIALARFWARRARRLLPAVVLVLGAVALSALLLHDRLAARAFARDGVASLLYVANWHFIDAGQAYIHVTDPDQSPLRHMWSLAIEEQFYLIWPPMVTGLGLLLARMRRGGRSFGRAVGGLAVALGVMSLLRMILLYSPTAPDRVYYGTDTRAFLLLVGAAVGALSAGAPLVSGARLRRLVTGAGLVVGAGLLLLMATVDAADSRLYRGGYGLVALAVIFVLVAAAQPGSNPLGRVLEAPGLVWLGLVSYGIYLWHWPAVIWLSESRTGLDGPALFAVRTVATLTLATASYYLVELPIRQRRWRPSLLPVWLRPVPAALVLGVSGVLLACAVARPAAVDTSVPAGAVPADMAAVAAAYQAAPHCYGTERSDRLAGLRVLLLGNSVAAEISECLGTLLRSHGASYVSKAANSLALCKLPELAREQFAQPAETRPNVVIVNYVARYDGCSTEENERAQLDELLATWDGFPVHTYLVPFVPPPEGADEAVPYTNGVPDPGTGPFAVLHSKEVAIMESAAARQPDRISLLDAGTYLRVGERYFWRMPCESASEPNCDSDGRLIVRAPDGVHLCNDPLWTGLACDSRYEGGRHRAVAAIVEPLLKSPPPTPR